MGEEIPDDEPTPKKCLMVEKNICVKNVMEMEYFNTTSRGRFVKSAEVHKYVNITSRSMVVKSVGAFIFNKKSIGGLGNMRKTIN